jgi:hypothetical protein
MDKEKEGVLGTIAEAAKISMDAALEGVSSAATNIVAAVTGKSENPRRQRKRSTTKKTAIRRTTTRRGKAKRPGTRRTRFAAATHRSTRKTGASKRTRRGTQAKRSTSKISDLQNSWTLNEAPLAVVHHIARRCNAEG